MKRRCTDVTLTTYKYYGGRGITYDPAWDNFSIFLYDMGEQPTGFQLDRVDNNKGYYKDNCRWVSPKVNSRNTRKNIHLTYNDETHCLSEWAELLGLKRGTLWLRYKKNYPIEQILNTNLFKRKGAHGRAAEIAN